MTQISRQNLENVAFSPFDLSKDSAYQIWRENKLAHGALGLSTRVVEIKDPENLSESERVAILQQCQQNNMALYRCERRIEKTASASGKNIPVFDKKGLTRLCAQLGLHRLDNNLCADSDGISSIQIEPKGSKQEYIPYSDHMINWHTDGYYNSQERNIRAMVLHCVRPSQRGGENGFIDHERIYIELRDLDVRYIEALMQADVMTIPANIQAGVEVRPAQTGPVFSIADDGQLHMRYTARSRSIEWKQDSVTLRAVQVLSELLSNNADYIYPLRLEAGHGIISNNVLHCRSKIIDDASQSRLLYRARYFDRVTTETIN